ncbi:MAG: hypothetical protein ACLQVJ_00100 [Syntrophobacteraceae bacterium]
MERALREAIGQTRKIKKQILRSSRPGWNFEALSAEKAETAERTILCSLFQNLCALCASAVDLMRNSLIPDCKWSFSLQIQGKYIDKGRNSLISLIAVILFSMKTIISGQWSVVSDQ